MLPEIQRRFDETILHEALRRAGVAAEACVPLGGFEASVYRLPGTILKITHTLRRSSEYLLGEIELVAHLAERGVSLPRPVPFRSGRRVESIPDGEGGAFLAYAYEEAEGALTTYDDWDDGFIETWGATAGQMIRAGQDFSPSQPTRRRQQWFDDDMLDLPACLPPEEAKTIEAGQALLRRLRALPQSPETFGLTHSDLHQYNFFRSPAGRLVPFDFDDCEYSPFVREVSIPLYYALGGIPDRPGAPSREAFGEHFLVCFLRGFQREVPLSRAQLAQLPAFLQLRSLILMSVLSTSVPEGPDGAARWAMLQEKLRRRIVDGEPAVALDFERLARQLAAR